jgi:dCMP deaminase
MDATLLTVAGVMATRSTCSRAHVGAIFARDGRILASGYNGSPRGMAHCLHPPGETTDTRGTDAPTCTWSVHAEANAIAFAARHGVALDGSALYVTHTPCVTCAQLIINVGVIQVIASHMYRVRAGINLLMDAGVIVLFWSDELGAPTTVPQ